MSEDTQTITKPTSKREIRVVEDNSAIANLMDTARFEHMFRIANAMAAASLIPEHLVGKKKGGEITHFTAEEVRANCFLIVNQSLRWGFDPFAVMPETYVVGGKLGYQGKLIAAVVNSRANLEGRLRYSFTGTKGTPGFTITVTGTFRGDAKPSEVTLSVEQAKTQNDMWTKDPEQKLIYSGAVRWARRHCPEIVLGVYTDDDLDRIAEREAAGRVIESAPKFAPRVQAEQETAPEPPQTDASAFQEPAVPPEKAQDAPREPEPAKEQAKAAPTKAEQKANAARLLELREGAEISMHEVCKFVRSRGLMRKEAAIGSEADIAPLVVGNLLNDWAHVAAEILAGRED